MAFLTKMTFLQKMPLSDVNFKDLVKKVEKINQKYKIYTNFKCNIISVFFLVRINVLYTLLRICVECNQCMSNFFLLNRTTKWYV